MQLITCIEHLASLHGYDAVVADNAYNYDLGNLHDILLQEDPDGFDYIVFDSAVYRLGADGYMESTPCYWLTGECI